MGKTSFIVPIKHDDDWPDEIDLPEGDYFWVKIQRSLTEPPTMLVYDKDRKYEYQSLLTPEIAAIMGDALKVYAIGSLVMAGENEAQIALLRTDPTAEMKARE